MMDIEQRGVAVPKDGYIVVGIGDEWDATKGLKMRRHSFDGKVKQQQGGQMATCYYSLSLKVDKAFSFQILDAVHHWKNRWYPPGNSHTTKRISIAVCTDGNEEEGHGNNWKVDVTPGQQVYIFFSPMTKCVMWTTQLIGDPASFQMPKPPRITFDEICAATQFKIEPQNDPLSKTLLTAASIEAAVVIAGLHIFPYLILILLLVWVTRVAATHFDIGVYKEGMESEWVNVTIIYLCIFFPKAYEIWNSSKVIRQVLEISRKISNNQNLVRGMRCAAVIEFMNLIQPIFALLLSVYIALFLSENIFLNVVLNVLALEFVSKVDEGMIAVYIKERFGEGSVVSFIITELHLAMGIHEDNDFWNESQLSKTTVLDTLRKGDISNDMRWNLITSVSKGLGLLGVLPMNRDHRRAKHIEDINQQCVRSVEIEITILDWSKADDAKIKEHGGLYLSATTDFTWESIISKKQKGLLLKYHPDIAKKFSWKGILKFSELDLNSSHAPTLVEIVNSNEEVVDVDLRGNVNLGAEGVKIIAHGLKHNKSLKRLSFHDCGLDITAAKYIGEMFKENDTLSCVWLFDNKNIGDEGAKMLMKGFVDEKGRYGQPGFNSSLHHLFLDGCNISKEFKEKCVEKTNAVFDFP